MRLKGQEINRFLGSPDISVSAVLIYGPDLGLVRERGNLLQGKVVEDASDPFRISVFSASDLRQDPAKLADEAAAIAMLGGRRIVRIGDATDAVTKTFEAFLKDPIGDSVVLVEAGDLAARSSLRKLFEGAKNAAAVPCYEDEGQTLSAVILDSLGRYNLKITGPAQSFLAMALGADRMATRAEIEKLALYMADQGEGAEVSLEDAQAVIGDRDSMALDAIINAVASGDASRMNGGLQRAYISGTQPVQILRGLIRHFGRLQLCAAEVSDGRSADQAIAGLRPPVFFKHQASFRNQLGRWTLRRTNTALELLMDAETDCKTTGLPDRAICSRACLQLAVMAGARSARA